MDDIGFSDLPVVKEQYYPVNHPYFGNASQSVLSTNACLSDQLFGQTWNHLNNLGYIYPKEKVKQTLESIWKYNWAPDAMQAMGQGFDVEYYPDENKVELYRHRYKKYLELGSYIESNIASPVKNEMINI